MADVTIRDLRNHGGEIVDRVAGGERVTITRSGRAVATLHPLRRVPLPVEVLLGRWQLLPVIDPDAMRRDIDETLDWRL